MVDESLRVASGAGGLIFLPIPWLSKIPFGSPKMLVKNLIEFDQFTQRQIESHEKEIDKSNPRDFIDLYINKMTETKVKIIALCGIVIEQK